MRNSFKQIISIMVFTLSGIFLMVWLYRDFDFHPLVRVFSVRGNYVWITLALASGVVANVFRSLRWRMLLRSTGLGISRWRAIELVFVSYLINSITPRLGELTRSVMVRRGNMEATAKAFGTVVIEKLADVGCLILVVAAAVILRWDDTVGLVERSAVGLTAAVPDYTLYIMAGCVICLVVGLTLPRINRVKVLMRNLWQGISSIACLEKPWGFGGLCAAIWMCNFLQLWLLIPCFDELSPLRVDDALYLFAAASLGVLLPTPGGAGPWHVAIVKCLTAIYHVPTALAKLFALVTHGLKTALVILLGLLALVTLYWETWMRYFRKSPSTDNTEKHNI